MDMYLLFMHARVLFVTMHRRTASHDRKHADRVGFFGPYTQGRGVSDVLLCGRRALSTGWGGALGHPWSAMGRRWVRRRHAGRVGSPGRWHMQVVLWALPRGGLPIKAIIAGRCVCAQLAAARALIKLYIKGLDWPGPRVQVCHLFERGMGRVFMSVEKGPCLLALGAVATNASTLCWQTRARVGVHRLCLLYI